MFLAHRQFRLARRSDGAGLSCDADGVALGGVQLLGRTGAGFQPRSIAEIDILMKAGYGAAFDMQALERGLAVAARALNDGDIGRAMVATLHLRLPVLDRDGAVRLAAVDAALAKYSPDQPRDWHGRWTLDGEGSGGPSQSPEAAKRPAARQSETQRHDRTGNGAAGGGNRQMAPSDENSVTTQPQPDVRQTNEPQDAGRQVDRPTGGRLIDARYQEADGDGEPGIGDNGGPPMLRPEGPQGPPPEPDPVLPIPKVAPGWDQPYRVVNGVTLPAGRYPKFRDGRPWPTPQPDEIYRMLDPRRGALPFVKLYVPLDGIGPMLMGTTEQGGDYIDPPGYEAVYLRGVPQRTTSRGTDTAHALESVARALRFAETNRYSDIYFNRSFSTISNGAYASSLRGDVVGRIRPTLISQGEYDVFEVLSPRQSGAAREQTLRTAVPGIHHFSAQAYKLLLKLLRALGLS